MSTIHAYHRGPKESPLMKIRIERKITIRRATRVQARYEVRSAYRPVTTPTWSAQPQPARAVVVSPTRTLTSRVFTSPSGAGPERLYVDPPTEAREWDVFISHASEDKESVARELASELKALGLRPWLDEGELKIGDSLRRKIDLGLAHSRFGVVILSHAFFRKPWPQIELDGLAALEIAGRQRILPIWHGLSAAEILSYSPTLAGKVAARTSDTTVKQIAEEIAAVVRSR